MNILRLSKKRAGLLVSSLTAAVLIIAPPIAMAATGTTSSSVLTPVYVMQLGSHGYGSGQLGAPTYLAVASNGNVYVSDIGNDRIAEFSSSGVYINQFGSAGSSDGEFYTPQGIAIASNGNVYVADSNNNRIQEFSSSGSYITQFGSYGSGNGQLDSPFGIAVASNGNIYVTDFFNSRAQVFTSDGNYVSQFGNTGGVQFYEPFGIAIAGNGNIYVADDYGYVQVFNSPQNLGTVASVTGSSQINLALPDTSNISSLTSSVPDSTDSGYNYPFGLVDFTSSVASGSTTLVTLTFQTDLKPGEVTARKYNPTTKEYTTIDGATITETTVSGQPALQLTYNVTDGGTLDQDGIVNGVIVDPVGLATVASTNVTTTAKAPNTGYGTPNHSDPLALATGTLAIIFIASGLALLYRQKRSRNSQDS